MDDTKVSIKKNNLQMSDSFTVNRSREAFDHELTGLPVYTHTVCFRTMFYQVVGIQFRHERKYVTNLAAGNLSQENSLLIFFFFSYFSHTSKKLL